MRRISETDQALAEALRELMGESPIEKISIKSITDKCNLNRQTFYYHFKDIYDLVRWMYTRDIEKAVQKAGSIKDWSGALRFFLREMDKDRAFHQAIYNSAQYYPRLRREFSELALESLRPTFTKRFEPLGYSEGYSQFLLRMYTLILFEYVERRALDIAFSSDESFIRHWTRTLEEQYLGAPLFRERGEERPSA